MSYVIPVKNAAKHRVTSPFGWRVDPVTKKQTKHHNGDDIVTGVKNEPVLAFANGRVLKARKSTAAGGGFGNYVVLRHLIDGTFYTSLYAHMQDGSLKVKEGQKVKAGDQLGLMGTTGHSTGIHLHFEIWKGSTHGWSADGKGFLEPLKFVKALQDIKSVKADAPKASPAVKKPNPVPVHEAKAAPKAAPKTAAKAAPKAAAKPAAKAPVAKKVDTTVKSLYTVKAGDSYWKIGKAVGIDYRKLQKLNNNKDLRPGDKIKLN